MRREKYIEDYEDFEPEQRSWPLFMLSFLVPLVPFVMNIFLGSDGFTPSLLALYILSVLPLFSASLCVKDGEKVWLLGLSGGLYFVFILIKWAVLKSRGGGIYPLSIPFALSLSPSLLSIIASAFFNKRRRGNWLGWAFLSFVLSAVLLYFTYTSIPSFTFYIILYPSLCLLLSLLLFFVTRRTESTPWYITMVLGALLIASLTLYPGLMETLLSGSANDKVNAVIKFFLYGFPFWYTLSFLFVFSSLAGKSSYRKVEIKDDGEKDGEEEIVVPPVSSERANPDIKRGYTSPPEYSRFDTSTPRRKEERVDETPKSRVVDERVEMPSSNDNYSAGNKDDKWYNFIEGGVDSSERGRNNLPQDSRSRDYPERRDDRYYDDRDRRYRDDRYYDERDRRYRDDRYYDERDRRYRDDRYYDEGDRHYRDDRYYDDRDRRYYDDDYPPYDDRDRRRR